MVAVNADTLSNLLLTILLAFSAEYRRTPLAELVHHCPAIQECPLVQPLASIECSNILPIGEQLSDITGRGRTTRAPRTEGKSSVIDALIQRIDALLCNWLGTLTENLPAVVKAAVMDTLGVSQAAKPAVTIPVATGQASS